MELTIKLLEGFNDIEFGISKEKFLETMGQAAQTETISEPDEPVTTILLNYPEMQTSFFFEGKNGKFYLNSCDTTNRESLLFGKKIFDSDKNGIVELFRNMGFEKYETAMEEWGEMRLTFENSMADFYFKDRKLVSVTWGY